MTGQARLRSPLPDMLNFGLAPGFAESLRAVLPELRERAARADRGAELDPDSLALLREAGVLRLPIPSEFGGGDGTALEFASALAVLASADGALALAINMHLFSVAVMVEHWRTSRDTSWLLLEAIATQGRIVASAFAEPGLNGSILRSACIGVKMPEGFRVSGVKTPCSLSLCADLICFQFESLEDDGERLLRIALVPANIPGGAVHRTWDSIAMRATESHTFEMTDCEVPDQLVFYSGEPGRDETNLFQRSIAWFCLGVASVYAGIAGRAIEELCNDHASQRRRGTNRYASSAIEVQIGMQLEKLSILQAAMRDLGRRLDEGGFDDLAMVGALAAKSLAVQTCPAIVADCVQLLGARSLSEKHVMSRLLRDVQAAPFHPPAMAAARQISARIMLGMDYQFELQS